MKDYRQYSRATSDQRVGGCHGAIQAAVKVTRSLASLNISKEAGLNLDACAAAMG